MCLIAIAYRASSRYPLVLAANRDERHSRPSAAADWWGDDNAVLGGRDLAAGGSWLAANRTGRVAAVTNFAEPAARNPAPKSRGQLVADFVLGRDSLQDFRDRVAREQSSYGGFNLLLFDGNELGYMSNRAPHTPLAAGVYGLSNDTLGADWPKLALTVASLEQSLGLDDPSDALLESLALQVPAADRVEHYKNSPFITGDDYGTRASTVILIDRSGQVSFTERCFDASGRSTTTQRFEFMLDASS